MRIVITGAAGHIGMLAAAELASHDLVLVDRHRTRDRRSSAANLSRAPALRSSLPWLPKWDRRFAGADVVLHLAAVLHPAGEGSGGWRNVRRHNVDATFHVLTAAADHRVPKVIFASSGWAVRGATADVGESAQGIGSDSPPRPVSRYGLSKAFGEVAGRMFVDEGRLRTFIAMRIGYSPPHGHAPADDWTRDCWIGPRDLARLIRRSVEADLVGFHVVYGVSGVGACPFDLTYTTRILDWTPVEVRRSDGHPV